MIDVSSNGDRATGVRRPRTRERSIGNCLLGVALIGLLGIGSLFSRPEEPDKAVRDFVALFVAQDAKGIFTILQPDIVADKELKVPDVESFVKRYRSNLLSLERYTVDKRMKSEDETTERFQATLVFRGPTLGSDYPDPSKLNMTLMWVLEGKQWWLERPISIFYSVTSDADYPTSAQREIAARFETSLRILDRIGISGKEDLAFIGPQKPGNAVEDFKELESLHAKERGAQGIHPTGAGVDVLLRAASREEGGLLQIYHGDFRAGPEDRRKPVPWDIFRDYVQAAIQRGKTDEKHGSKKKAESVYRRVISFGRMFLNEPGGFQFANWGLTFEKQGAHELARVASSDHPGGREPVVAFANLVSRRLDLLQTALACLDDMADYGSLKAAVDASNRPGDIVFKPWGINTLLILALKGAPAGASATKEAGGIVLVENPRMKKAALQALDDVSKEASGKVKAFVEFQKQWIESNQVYGTGPSFQ